MGEYRIGLRGRPTVPSRLLPLHRGELIIRSRAYAVLMFSLQADNDFETTHGFSLGQPYNAGVDNDNQFMVWRVTLPTATNKN